LLAVRDLAVVYRGLRAVDGASFHIDAAVAVGLLGESGCGKSSVALAIPGLLPPGGRVERGAILWRGSELRGLSETRMAALRGAEIALVFQEPALALNPVMRVGDQICEVLRAHRPWPRRRVREHAAEVLARLCPHDAARIFDSYPHQLSGGQRQRVAIAQAVALQSALIVADELTASLDATVQAEILALFAELKWAGAALLLVTHNPAALTNLADRVLVMYAGRIVEEGPFAEVLLAPRHPYTRALVACAPKLHVRGLPAAIPGAPPDPAAPAAGCAFAPRCVERTDICISGDPPGERVRCFHHAA
jgi:oligopeptide/dipeptide ABC transporter ATP-binding protein